MSPMICYSILLNYHSHLSCILENRKWWKKREHSKNIMKRLHTWFCGSIEFLIFDISALRGAATLRGRPGHRERIKGSSTPTLQFNEHYFDFGRCRASLAKGEELLVRTEDGMWCDITYVREIDLTYNFCYFPFF